MLTELHVEHLGVIGALDLVLGPGLIAVTGETGAGKTLIVDAIGLLTGARTPVDLVHAEADEARVDGRFVDGDEEHVLTRVVPRTGRTRGYVDGRLATATHLAERGQAMVELHGQHQHQSLLRRRVQRDALDTFAGIDTEPLRRARARLTELDAELAALGGDERARMREIDLLRHQIDEIDRAALHDPDEEERLEEEQDLLADAVEHRRLGAAVIDLLHADDGVLDRLGSARHQMEGRRAFQTHAERLHAVAVELDDVADALRRELDRLDEDPERLHAVIHRRQQLRDLRRRYGDSVRDVVAYADAARERLAELSGHEERARVLDEGRRRAAAEAGRLARIVGDARRSAARSLGEEATRQLRRLALAHAVLGVTVGDAVSDPGGESVAFWFTANPGFDPLPLSRVASGGELSRIMLALRLVLGGGPSTLVFDEVDAGIGGEAAGAVAEALVAVARHRQVLVVTHLAQVAARADLHVVVDKKVVDARTVTSVSAVAGEARVTEIARMLSGQPQSARAREHAAELLETRNTRPIDDAAGAQG